MVWGWICDFHPTSCVFSTPEPWRGNRKHSTSWIKVICNPKPLEILIITYLNDVLLLFFCFKVHSLPLFKPNNALNVCKQYYASAYSSTLIKNQKYKFTLTMAYS